MSRSVVIALAGLTAAIAAVVLFLVTQRDEHGMADAGPPPAAVPTPESATGAPAFDVVRIGERGDAVIAGRAMPRAEVTILDGGRELGRVTADARGEWVFVPAGPLPPGARELGLEAHNPDGTSARSGAPVILVVPEQPGMAALAVRRDPGGGGRVLQGAGGDGALSLDLVDREGDRLFVGGRAEPGATVQIYLDNRLLGRAATDADGEWRLTAKAPTHAPRTLRADQVDSRGKVTARIEAPYEAAASGTPAPGTVVVQPGNSLWRIARTALGSGPAYMVVYQANRDRIRNPDLIYPGQVLNLPR